ncbi:UvrD-helicase domain-containing protein [Actinobacillus equuli subsp. haemolyticus]|uniref:UvrD-helicase domain-containing protein n=1 Tax=Actinobacillus equuli TaxID=718 RepID=UPI002442E802|nr:UvrD-helicase domain-containing protein [Actinobacillus equuli]WGE80790.1 UvrD-helicase domain-containing protein [Actinobacillus equuli subsp. haemolyticus]
MKKLTLAEQASKDALDKLYECLDNQAHFRLEAGAGAGKTYSLIKALNYLIDKKQDLYMKQGKKIACITYTNIAKDEILARTDRNPIVFCETLHAFCWNLISSFQKQLQEFIPEIPMWKDILEKESENSYGKKIIYELGHQKIKDGKISLHHDDVITLTVRLLNSAKFRQIIIDRYPIILIDEYQDTNKDWIEAIKSNFLDNNKSPLFGFFGDHWQKIYGKGCGLITHNKIVEIGKKANFRSNHVIVSALNKMRQDLPQTPNDEEPDGSIHIFHTNHWSVKRQNSSHWKGDLFEDDFQKAFKSTQEYLVEQGWDSSTTKILMLTHKLLAKPQGYSGIANTFRYNESFIKKEHKYIEFLIDKLEPACEAFNNKKYGVMFSILEQKLPLLCNHSGKLEWKKAMGNLLNIRETGTIKDVIDLLKETSKPKLPDSILNMEEKLSTLNSLDELSTSQRELRELHNITYSEIVELKKFLDGHSPFQTQHGVKGAEFENVLVIIGRGWNQYNFGEMLKWVEDGIPNGKEESFDKNRNLFYVACSRPKKRLAILFTQQLEDSAMKTLNKWFGVENIVNLLQK